MLGHVLQFLYGMGNCVWNCRFSSERLLTIGDLQFQIFLVLYTSPRGGLKMTFGEGRISSCPVSKRSIIMAG
jgi:hypothetical protein